jgi:hypothetical protein
MDNFNLSLKTQSKEKLDPVPLIDLETNPSIFNNCFTETKEYEVENILDRKFIGKKRLYLVKWKGFSENESTWEPRCNLLNLGRLLDKYDKRFDHNDMKKQIDRNNSNFNFKESPERETKLEFKRPSFHPINSQKVKFKHNFFNNDITQDRTLESIKFQVISNDESKKASLNDCKILTYHDIVNSRTNMIDNSKGSIEYDIPYKILGYVSNDSETKFFVSWKAREDNSIPEPSYLTANQLRKNHSSLLFDYYADCFNKLVKIEKILIRDKDLNFNS